MSRDAIHCTSEQLEQWVHSAALAGRTLTIEMHEDHASLKMGRHTFIAPLTLSPLPNQRRAGDES